MKTFSIARLAAHRLLAFSLIEIMVAVSLLAVIIVGLLAMFYQTQRAFRSGATQMDVMEGGRAAVELIAREMEEMAPILLLNETNFWAAEDRTFSLEQTMPSGPSSRNQFQNISFFTRGADSWKVTAYHVTTPLGALNATLPVPAFRLSRLVVELATNPPPEVIAAIQRQIGVPTKYPFPEDDPGPPVNRNPPFTRVMDGVVNFSVVGFDLAGYEYYVGSSSWLDYIYPNLRLVPNGTITNHFPAALDLILGVLEPKSLDRFRAKLDNRPANLPVALTYLTNQAASVHLFRQRIRIRSTP